MKYTTTSPPAFITLVFLTGLSVLSLNMFIPSLANIADEFETDYSIVSFSIAGYLGITAILQLIVGPLSDRYGRRPVLLFGLVIFNLASLGCIVATNIWVFLFFRIMQGTVISGAVVSYAIIRDTADEQNAASQMGYVSMAMAVAPMIGPVIGGVLDEEFGWRSIFIFYIVSGLLLLALCWVDLGESNKHRSDTFVKQLKEYPILLRSRVFWGYSVCVSFSVGAFYIFISGIPLVAETFYSLSPSSIGFYVGSITGGFALGSFLSGRYSTRYSLTTMILAGRIAACFGLMTGLTLFLTGFGSLFILFGSTLFVGFGNGLTSPGATSGALSVHPKLAGSASGLTGALTVGTGAILTSLSAIILTADDGPYQLLCMMLACSAVGLIAALDVWRNR